MAYSVGETLQAGKYLLDTLLEEHPWGMTFLATHQGVSQQVIIKTYTDTSESGGPKKNHLDSYIDFAKSLIRFHHPGLSRVIHAFQEENHACMVSEFVQGKALTEFIDSAPMEEQDAIALIRKVSLGLHGLHRHGLMHLNLRPSRILKRDDNQDVVLIGLNSRFSGQAQTRALNPYLAVEQNQPSGKVSLVTEIYGIAATLYTLVTGKHPTPASQRHEEALVTPQHWKPSLSDRLEEAILRGMAIDPRDRPQNMKAWLELLPKVEESSIATRLQVPPAWEVKLPAFQEAGVTKSVNTIIQPSTPIESSPKSSPETPAALSQPENTQALIKEDSQPTDQIRHPEVHPELDSILADLTSNPPEQTTTLQVQTETVSTPASTTKLQRASEASSQETSPSSPNREIDSSESDMVANSPKAKTASSFPKWTLLWCAVIAACGGLAAGLWFRMKLTQPIFGPEPTAEETPLDQFRSLDSRQEDFLPTPSSVIPGSDIGLPDDLPPENTLDFEDTPSNFDGENSSATEFSAEPDLESNPESQPFDPWTYPGQNLNEARFPNSDSFLDEEADTTNTESLPGLEEELGTGSDNETDLDTVPQDQSWNNEDLADEIPGRTFGAGQDLIYDPNINTF